MKNCVVVDGIKLGWRKFSSFQHWQIQKQFILIHESAQKRCFCKRIVKNCLSLSKLLFCCFSFRKKSLFSIFPPKKFYNINFCRCTDSRNNAGRPTSGFCSKKSLNISSLVHEHQIAGHQVGLGTLKRLLDLTAIVWCPLACFFLSLVKPFDVGVPPQLSGFICTYHPAAPGSSHKHTIYAICAIFVRWKKRK